MRNDACYWLMTFADPNIRSEQSDINLRRWELDGTDGERVAKFRPGTGAAVGNEYRLSPALLRLG